MVSRQLSGRWTGATAGAVGVIAATVMLAAPAQAAQAPSDGGPSCWFQTNGRDVPLNNGDWYTSRLTASEQRSHLFHIVVPAGAHFPVAVRVRDAEVRVASTELHDEVANGADPTRFTLRRPDGSLLDRQTFPPSSPAGSVFHAAIMAADGPGTYRLLSETGAFPISGDRSGMLNDDQNSFRVEVLPDGGTTPEASDDVRIEFSRTTIACTPLPGPPMRLTLAYTVPDGTTVTSLRNFDLDVNPAETAGAPTYVPPTGQPIFGTMSVDSAWNGGGTRNAGEDVVPVGADQNGRWTINVPQTYWKNQVVFEAWAGSRQLPLSVVPLNRPAAWQDPAPVTVSEPVGDEPVPVVRPVDLQIDELDPNQTLSFSLPQGGACKMTAAHPFAGASFGESSVVSDPDGNEMESATLQLPVGAQEAGTHCVRVRVTDGASAHDIELTVTVTQANSAPRANAGPDKSAHQPGDTVTLDGSLSDDPDGDPVTISWAGFEPGEPAVGFPAPAVGTYTYTVAADDGEHVRTDDVLVTVRDGEPVVFPPRFQTLPARRLVAVRLGSFDDPGSAGPWGVTAKWGTNGPVQTLADTTDDDGSLSALHRFRNGGLYSLTVTVTDEGGKPGAKTFNVRVRPPCRVPDVRGKTLTRARKVLKRRSCTLGSVRRVFSGRVRAGRIISQKPRPGAVRATGAKVRVKVSRGPRG